MIAPSHHFHPDARGHSVTVNIHSGHPGLIEVLVDGKETDHVPLQGEREPPPARHRGAAHRSTGACDRPYRSRAGHAPLHGVIGDGETLMSPRAF